MGTDISAELDGKKHQQRAVCLSHFSDPKQLKYQDLTQFVTSTGKTVRVESCRLCHRFELETLMVPLAGQLSGQCLSMVIHQTLKIRLKAEDFLRAICQECLATVDLIRAVQSRFLKEQVIYQGLEKLMPTIKLVPEVQQQEVYEISDDDEYENVEFIWEPEESNTTMLEIELGVLPPARKYELPKPMQSIVKEEVGCSSTRSPDTEITLEVELLEETSSSVKRKKHPQKQAKQKQSAVVKEKKKRGPKVKPNPGPKKVEDRLWFISSKTCYICTTEFADKDELLIHLTKTHARKINYACQECDGMRFSLVTTYNWHLSLHDPRRPLKCNFCSIRYCFPNSIRNHENKFHGTDHKVAKWKKTVKNVQCETCGKLFMSHWHAQEHHMRVHEKKIMSQCKICDKTFVNNANLKRHMVVHTDERPYECDVCGTRYRTSTERNKHVLTDHEHKVGYRCSKCDIPLKDRSEYFRHRDHFHHKFRHTASPAEKCSLCSEQVENIKALESHIEGEHPDEEYPYQMCPHCPKEFLSAKQLYTHNYCTHQNSFICEECGKHFTDKGNWKRHVSVVHREDKRFQCDHCPMKFGQKDSMLNHRRNIHTGERPFKCDSCGRKFKDFRTFHKHRKACASSEESEHESEGSED